MSRHKILNTPSVLGFSKSISDWDCLLRLIIDDNHHHLLGVEQPIWVVWATIRSLEWRDRGQGILGFGGRISIRIPKTSHYIFRNFQGEVEFTRNRSSCSGGWVDIEQELAIPSQETSEIP